MKNGIIRVFLVIAIGVLSLSLNKKAEAITCPGDPACVWVFDPPIFLIDPCLIPPKAGTPGCAENGCDALVVNSTDASYGKCYKDYCTFNAALEKAKTCPAPKKVEISSTVTINSNNVNYDGGDGRVTVQAKAGSNLKTAFDLKKANAKISNLYFTGFTDGPVIKLTGADAKNFRLGYVTTDTANVKMYDPSGATAANNSTETVPLLMIHDKDKNELFFFAVVPFDAEPKETKLRFINTTDLASKDFLSDNNFTDTASLKTYVPKATATGTDPTGGTKIILEGKLPVSLKDKVQLVLINEAGKNVNIANFTTSPFLTLDTDGDFLPDALETAFGTNPSKNENNDFFRAFAGSGDNYAPCFDGTKFVFCNSTLSADQTATPPGDTAQKPGGGCSNIAASAPIPNSVSFALLAGITLCLGLMFGRRLSLNRLKK